MMVIRRLRRAVDASRTPKPSRTIDASELIRAQPQVSLGIGASLDRALRLLPWRPDRSTLLIPAHDSSAAIAPTSLASVVSWIAGTNGVVIASGSTEKAGGLRSVVHGRNGYIRIQFGDRSLILDSADYPTDIFEFEQVVIVAEANGAGVLRAWTSIVHPNTSLRARMSGNAVIELAAAIPARYLIVASVDSQSVVAHATNAITAELVARAIERLPQRRRGFETSGPWEDAGVQHLSDLGDATPATINLVVDVAVEDNDSRQVGQELAELLGWTVAWVNRD